MTNETEQQEAWAAVEGSTGALMEEKINRLKGSLEEKMSRSQAKARWAGMVEDCDIILHHLGSSSR